MTKEEKLAGLSVDSAEKRLAHLRELLEREEEAPVVKPQFANNHIHTSYSFSPYSPTAAVYFAREAGLPTAGIMDHDSIGGAEEFRRAGEIAGVAVTCGIECRVDMSATALSGRRLNNPDQDGIAYMAVHSVMPDQYAFVQERFQPLRERRNVRNQAMVQKINGHLAPLGLLLDFEKDVLPASLFHLGGTVTERHLLWALSGKLLSAFGPRNMMEALGKLEIAPSAAQSAKLTPENPYVRYDLLGILKAHLVQRFYIPAREECMRFDQLAALAERVGAILCYAYLGDVGESVTGDKRPERYEDSFLDELFAVLHREGVKGATYMPSRNTAAQIARLRALCSRYGMLEISGEDINAPQQSFVCEKLEEPGFSHLVDATWMLIEREKGGNQR